MPTTLVEAAELQDELEKDVANIERQIAENTRGEEWAGRARGALAHKRRQLEQVRNWINTPEQQTVPAENSRPEMQGSRPQPQRLDSRPAQHHHAPVREDLQSLLPQILNLLHRARREGIFNSAEKELISKFEDEVDRMN